MDFDWRHELRAFKTKNKINKKIFECFTLFNALHSGVMKHVGEAMHEYSSWSENDKATYEPSNPDGGDDEQRSGMSEIPLIGFTTYHTLSKSVRVPIEDYRDGHNDEVTIPSEAQNSKIRGTYLDKNHSHFVLVSSKENQEKCDKGLDASFGEEIDLWAKAEKYRMFTSCLLYTSPSPRD